MEFGKNITVGEWAIKQFAEFDVRIIALEQSSLMHTQLIAVLNESVKQLAEQIEELRNDIRKFADRLPGGMATIQYLDYQKMCEQVKQGKLPKVQPGKQPNGLPIKQTIPLQEQQILTVRGKT